MRREEADGGKAGAKGMSRSFNWRMRDLGSGGNLSIGWGCFEGIWGWDKMILTTCGVD